MNPKRNPRPQPLQPPPSTASSIPIAAPLPSLDSTADSTSALVSALASAPVHVPTSVHQAIAVSPPAFKQEPEPTEISSGEQRPLGQESIHEQVDSKPDKSSLEDNTPTHPDSMTTTEAEETPVERASATDTTAVATTTEEEHCATCKQAGHRRSSHKACLKHAKRTTRLQSPPVLPALSSQETDTPTTITTTATVPEEPVLVDEVEEQAKMDNTTEHSGPEEVPETPDAIGQRMKRKGQKDQRADKEETPVPPIAKSK
ncbi:hypothetical protein BGX28_005832, partial [Mortierella sp. GBA30]